MVLEWKANQLSQQITPDQQSENENTGKSESFEEQGRQWQIREVNIEIPAASTNIDDCTPNPCNTTTSINCIDGANDYTCNCKPGYTGKYCDTDALSHGFKWATCHDKENRFTCDCPPRLYGVVCDTNICHPTPADVVFVLDSSLSMSEQEFTKQLEFVANFSSKVPIGPRDFQISVVTFSTDANVEFYLNQYKDNVSLHDAIMNVNYKYGITRTDKGLEKVRTEVFSPKHGIERRINGTQASKFVYVLTDGMSTYIMKTKEKANDLRSIVDTIAAIGIGTEVSHQELIDIASDPSFVYSVKNFNSLYTVLKRLVHFDCDECGTSAASDVAIFLDSSYSVTAEQYSLGIDAIIHMIDVMKHLSVNNTRVSVTSFSDDIRSVIGMGETFNKNVIKRTLNMIAQSHVKTQVQLETVYAYARDSALNKTIFRQGAKKFFLIFTNGKADMQINLIS
ncbi:transmembrane cell adhesion receptor mua-3-like [Ruditapes philippinarum]|uniref:transmembrane cell adhesion receptor mua-3-like n=1 Tax=Ruditapes philippinarum TaxID=129788 RepID=UPI00295C3599|nr:transmembrane cell adhesion receptor mua-3-like [Ruditapes philippinarum]